MSDEVIEKHLDDVVRGIRAPSAEEIHHSALSCFIIMTKTHTSQGSTLWISLRKGSLRRRISGTTLETSFERSESRVITPNDS